jgi:colanic acid/amylovoran biosynthesis glycosyltransferase
MRKFDPKLNITPDSSDSLYIYITQSAPWGKGEHFVIDEMLALKEKGIELLIIPYKPLKEIFHQSAYKLLNNTFSIYAINASMLSIFLKNILHKGILCKTLYYIFRYSRNPRIVKNNVTAAIKGVYIYERLKKSNIIHIHAHWGTTTSTMAYVLSQLTKRPWSLTLHRYDIKRNNLLKEKIKKAKFVRCISEDGRSETISIVGGKYKQKINTIHIGVKIPGSYNRQGKNKRIFIFAIPAYLVEKKGHIYLINACDILAKKGYKDFNVIFYGNGPLAASLQQVIQRLHLEQYIKIDEFIPHEKLMNIYRNGEINAVVLPSINTEDGQREGIPVSLMEAMAHKIPVISTDTGGIPELLSGGAGIMVEEKDPEALARAMETLIRDKGLRRKLCETGFRRVKEEFDINKITNQLLRLMESESHLEPAANVVNKNNA